jgi:glycosyltransferase involved in cell wall biosynthesis
MKIAQLVSNFHKVVADSTQAIYSHVALLANGLTDLGHEVTLYASGDSESKAKLKSVTQIPTSKMEAGQDAVRQYMHLLISKCYKEAKNFDIIHSHFNLLTSFYADLVDIPTVFTLHTPIDDKTRSMLANFKNNYFVSFTYAQRTQMPELNWIANIYHGLDISKFEFNLTPKDYFIYLGRITEDKGVHLAIEAANAAGVPLVIAGRSYPEEKYWHSNIEKKIDGKMVTFIGEANFETKIEYLKNAKALLFPTQRIEPFGLVMIEAMACGTPVIGFNNGSVPEVVKDKQTGYVVNSVEEMVSAIKSIDKIDRNACRSRAEKYFSVEKMVSGYEKVYRKVIDRYQTKNKK